MAKPVIANPDFVAVYYWQCKQSIAGLPSLWCESLATLSNLQCAKKAKHFTDRAAHVMRVSGDGPNHAFWVDELG
jgi:hypothetical protein